MSYLPVSRERYNADVDRWRTAAEQATEKLRGDAERWQREKDALVTEAQSALQQVTDYWQARYDTLLAMYHELRIVGANPKEPERVIDRRPPDPVASAVIAKSGNSLLRRKYYAEYVAEQRALHIAEEDIAKAILDGVPVDDIGVPA